VTQVINGRRALILGSIDGSFAMNDVDETTRVLTVCSEVEAAEAAERDTGYRRVDGEHDKDEGEPKQLDSLAVKPVRCVPPHKQDQRRDGKDGRGDWDQQSGVDQLCAERSSRKASNAGEIQDVDRKKLSRSHEREEANVTSRSDRDAKSCLWTANRNGIPRSVGMT
jgi:hypothetical protein